MGRGTPRHLAPYCQLLLNACFLTCGKKQYLCLPHFLGLNEAAHPKFLSQYLALPSRMVLAVIIWSRNYPEYTLGLMRNIASKLFTTMSSWADQSLRSKSRGEDQQLLQGHGSIAEGTAANGRVQDLIPPRPNLVPDLWPQPADQVAPTGLLYWACCCFSCG